MKSHTFLKITLVCILSGASCGKEDNFSSPPQNTATTESDRSGLARSPADHTIFHSEMSNVPSEALRLPPGATVITYEEAKNRGFVEPAGEQGTATPSINTICSNPSCPGCGSKCCSYVNGQLWSASPELYQWCYNGSFHWKNILGCCAGPCTTDGCPQ
jgi:hypothetical protein